MAQWGRLVAVAAVTGGVGAVAGAAAYHYVLRPMLAVRAAGPEAGPFVAGAPLGVTVDGATTPMTPNVRVVGGMVDPESCVFDASRDAFVVFSRGAPQRIAPNDGYAAIVDPDGTLRTAKWIGATRAGLTLNDPLGSDIGGGVLYVNDREGGTGRSDPTRWVVRRFDLATGAPLDPIPVPEATGLNDLAVAPDGTLYLTQSGRIDEPETWRIYRVSPDGAVTTFAEGAPMNLPNGVAVDAQGNVVVVNIADDAVLTYGADGVLKATERAAQPGSDGLWVAEDGTKYVSSVQRGGISRIPPGGVAELIAAGVPGAASLCYDPVRRRIAIPLVEINALALIPVD